MGEAPSRPRGRRVASLCREQAQGLARAGPLSAGRRATAWPAQCGKAGAGPIQHTLDGAGERTSSISSSSPIAAAQATRSSSASAGESPVYRSHHAARLEDALALAFVVRLPGRGELLAQAFDHRRLEAQAARAADS